MKKSIGNIIILSLIVMSLFLISKIQLLIIYLFISIVLSITINPLNNRLCNIKFKNNRLNKNIAALICLMTIAFFTTILGYILSPLIIEVSSLDLKDTICILTREINDNFNINIDAAFGSIQCDNLNSYETTVNQINNNKITSFNSLDKIFNFSSLNNMFQSMFEILGNMLFAIFSILFISFFLIRDKDLFKIKAINTINLLIPNAKQKINTIIYFIRRYFIGLCTQTLLLFVLFGIGMSIIKIPHAWTLAVFAAVINIIPYFGPLIGFAFTTTVLGAVCSNQPEMLELFLPLTIKSFILFGTVQSIDNFIVQPSIYSKAFNTHPLEIFFIAMTAGLIGGIMWMIIAMPVYTIIRVLFAELITNIQKT